MGGVWVSPKFRSCRLRLCRDGFAQFEPGAVLPPCALFPRVHAGWGISSQPLLGLAFPNGTRRIWFLEVCGGGRGGELRWSGPREGGSRMSQAQLRSPGEWGSETSAIPNMNTKTLRVLFAKSAPIWVSRSHFLACRDPLAKKNLDRITASGRFTCTANAEMSNPSPEGPSAY